MAEEKRWAENTLAFRIGYVVFAFERFRSFYICWRLGKRHSVVQTGVFALVWNIFTITLSWALHGDFLANTTHCSSTSIPAARYIDLIGPGYRL